MPDATTRVGGDLTAAVTSALIGIHTEWVGRGPRSASTFCSGNVIVTLMHGVRTQVEHALTEADHGETVRRARHVLQDVMQSEFCAAVERLSGRKVLAFIGGDDIGPDVAAEVFILDGPVAP
jgi:uncharacterized protein YbcI